MKKAIILVVTAMTLFLAGCMDQHTDIQINADGSTKVTQTILLSEGLTTQIEEAGEDPSQVLADEFIEELGDGVFIDRYEDGRQSGVKLTQAFSNLEDTFASSLFVSEDVIDGKIENPWSVETKDNPFFYSVKITGTVDYTEWLTGGKEEDHQEQVENMTDESTLTYSITTPTKSTHNNAKEVDGRTHLWEVEAGEVQAFELEFQTLKVVPVAIASGVLVIMLLSIPIIVKRIRNKA